MQFTAKLEGQVITGGGALLTTMENEQLLCLPTRSMAMHKIIVVPEGNRLPEVALQVSDAMPAASVAVGANVAVALVLLVGSKF